MSAQSSDLPSLTSYSAVS